MNILLFVPGILFLLVIFFRVILPLIRDPRWKRLIDSARYHRHREQMEKSDRLLEKAIASAPERPEPYMEYYLNFSDQGDLQKRFGVLTEGRKSTGDLALEFMAGSALLEEGDLDDALAILDTSGMRRFMAEKRVFLLVHLFIELNRPDDAEQAYFDILNFEGRNKARFLDEQTALDLCPYLFILMKRGEDPHPEMERIPRTSVRSEMGWVDLQQHFNEMKDGAEPAATGIHGSPDRFNSRRAAFIGQHLDLINGYLGE